MESEVFPPYLEQFMLSPLVTWVKTFGPNDGATKLDYSDLLDGVFLNEIMNEIDPKASLQSVHRVNVDSSRRVQNLTVLMRQIKTYYLENLSQLLMMAPPNMLVLGKSPHSERGLDEINKLLLLLLGCAVQCERKEEYIERIQTLDFDTKAAIAGHIQEVTHSEESVLDLHWLEASDLPPEDLETASRNMTVHLRRLVEQRDAQLETIAELVQERERPPTPPPPSSGERPSMQQQEAGAQQHLAVELADSKARIRRLRQELEEKSEQVLDGRLELDNMEAELKRFQKENASLLADARAARTYRDELDALRERAIRADKLESEVGRYREKLHAMEFYKTKVEDLKEDNQVLLETKAVLEEQVGGLRARSDRLHHLEKHSLLLKAHVHDLEQEKEVQRRRMEELQEENLALCLAQRRSMDESQHLGWELEQLSKSPDNTEGQKSLSEEVNDRTSSRLLRLESENQSLHRTIEEMSERLQRDQDAVRERRPLGADTRGSDKSASLFRELLLVRKEAHDMDARDERDLKEYRRSGEPEGETPRPDGEGEAPEVGTDLQEQEKGQLEEEGDLKDLTPDPEALEKGSPRRSPNPLRDGVAGRSPYAAKHAERLEVRCRALDTENQRLQAALDNTGRKLQHVEAEVQDLEAENQALQAGLEELRISSRRLEQLEQENHSLEQEASALERDKRRLEKENRRLKQQAEIQDATLDGANVRVASLERDARVLGKVAEGLRETAERAKLLEGDNRELAKQTAIDQRTLATLREELVSEKLKSQQRENELERQAHDLEMRVLDQEAPERDEDAPENSRFKMLESELESSLKRSLQIKEDKMAALEARLRESSGLNQQLRQELKTVRLNYEALQQREEEGRAAAACSAPQRESDRAASEWQRESQEATRELLRVKDRLIEVERNNATLQAERQALQAQLRQLEAQSDSLQAQILALQRQTASLQENNTALQTHNANLQVEKSTLSSQSASLLAQNAQLQRQQSAADVERQGAARDREELRSVHAQLLRDHERLAALQERQAQEYEALMGKHGCLKNAHRSLELEHRTLQDRYNTLLQQRARLEGLEKALREEQDKMAVEKEQHRSAASECRRLRDEKDWLNQTYRQLVKDNEELQADHRHLKGLLNSAKLDQARLESDFSKLREQHQQLDITSTKLTNQCELLGQLKGNLEEENRHLLDQIKTLMLQNRTLLEQTMESKDLFHVEQRQYTDKLNELRRQKEKLEEKIMDQYKFYDPSPPRRRGNWIALKMRQLIKPRSRERDSERSLHSPTPTRSGSCEVLGGPRPSPCCLDNGSFVGSDGSSGGSACASVADALSPRRRGSKSAMKIFPLMRNRLKDRDKVASLFRRSKSLGSLAHPTAAASDQWVSSSELLEGEAGEGGEEREEEEEEETPTSPSLVSSTLSVIHCHHHHHSTTTNTTTPSCHLTANAPAVAECSGLWLTDKDSNDSAVPSGLEDSDELQNHGLNGAGSRAQSESSGEFSLSLDNEPWSNDSSPIQRPLSRRSSSSCQPPSDASTPRHARPPPNAHRRPQTPAPLAPPHREKASKGSPVADAQTAANGDAWPRRRSVIRRASSGRDGRRSSEARGAAGEAPGARSHGCSPIAVLYVQGKSSSVSGCLNCFSAPLGREGRPPYSPPPTLPRASSVISTAEGTSRRCSLNLDSRAAARAGVPAANGIEGVAGQSERSANRSGREDTDRGANEPVPPVKPPRDPAAAAGSDLKPSCEESLFGAPFNFNSLFSDTIFSESAVAGRGENGKKDQAYRCLNPSLVPNVSCPPPRHEPTNGTALTEDSTETGQSQNGRHNSGDESRVNVGDEVTVM